MKLKNSVKTMRSLMISIFVLLSLALIAKPQSLNKADAGSPRFRYVFVENRLDEDEKPEETRRVIEVLLDEKAFSKGTLRKLFTLISNRFPDDRVLYVTVHTRLEQIPTPEERDEGTISESKKHVTKFYYWAVYVR